MSSIFLEEGTSEDEIYRKKKNVPPRWHEQRTFMGAMDIGELGAQPAQGTWQSDRERTRKIGESSSS